MPVCDICQQPMNWDQGYGLNTTQVTTSEAYWKYLLTHFWAIVHDQDPVGKSLSNLVERQRAFAEPWLVCNSCAELLEFDRETARRYNKQGARPPGLGPAQLSEVARAAAYAWSTLYDSWPASVQFTEKAPANGDDLACDFCRRIIGPDEQLAFMKRAMVEAYEQLGGLKRRGPASHHLAEEAAWIACQLCIQRANRIVAPDQEVRATGACELKDARKPRFAVVCLELFTAVAESRVVELPGTDILPRRFAEAIEQAAKSELNAYGHGAAFQNLCVRITRAQHHPVDSHADDFDEATRIAIRQAITKLGTKPESAKGGWFRRLFGGGREAANASTLNKQHGPSSPSEQDIPSLLLIVYDKTSPNREALVRSVLEALKSDVPEGTLVDLHQYDEAETIDRALPFAVALATRYPRENPYFRRQSLTLDVDRTVYEKISTVVDSLNTGTVIHSHVFLFFFELATQ